MKSLEARQAERAQRKAEEDEARKASGAPDNSGDDETGDDTGKKGKGRAKGPTTTKDIANLGGGDPQEGNGGGTGGGNPFGNT